MEGVSGAVAGDVGEGLSLSRREEDVSPVGGHSAAQSSVTEQLKERRGTVVANPMEQ